MITLILAVITAIWWYRQQRRQRRFPPDTFPFAVIRPNGNVLQRAFGEGEEDNDPLANSRISYQTRVTNRDIQQELEKRLNESRWLLILGRTGLGKTREAAELVQLLNRERWTVHNLKVGAWLDIPTPEQRAEIGTNRKLLFFLDDLNQRMHFSGDEPSPRAKDHPLEPLTVPLQERLLRALEAYEQFCGEEEIRVVATARDEKHSDKPGEPSQWEKLEWEKYPRLWQRFAIYSPFQLDEVQ